MRPIRLEITAFGPFPGTEVIDFACLPTDQPFVISGPTGAGKTSIFDAMCLALFGGLPGARLHHTEVRSTFAPLRAECQVTFEFALGDQRYKVWRMPAQTRAKVRGTGITTTPAKATLHRWDGGEWVPLASRVSEVGQRVPELLGITAELFQRSVLLPQGEFHRVLRAGTTERAGLLRALFRTQVFVDAIDRVSRERKELSTVLADADTTARANLDVVATRLDAALVALEGRGSNGAPDVDENAGGGAVDPDDDGRDGAGADAQVIDLTDHPRAGDAGRGDPGQVDPGSVPVDAPDAGATGTEGEVGPEADGPAIDPGALRAEVDRLAGAPLTTLEQQSGEATRAAADLRAERGRSEQVARDVRRRDELAVRVAEGEAGADGRDAERRLLDRAEAAAPVVAAAGSHHTAQQEQLAATEARAEAWGAAVPAAIAAGVDVDPAAAERLPDPEVADEVAALLRAGADTARRHADTLTRARENLAAAGVKRADAATAAGTAERERARVDELQADVAATTTRIDEARTAGTEAQQVAAGLAAAGQDEARACRALETAKELQAARVDLVRARTWQAYGRATLAAASRAVESAESVRDAATTGAEDLDAARAAQDEAAAVVAELDQLSTARSSLPMLQQRAAATRAAADAAVRAFADGAAARLAADLRPDEPCAVCGSTEHPAPASADEGRAPVDIAEVEDAQQAAEEAGRQADFAHQEITGLLTRRPELRHADPAAARAELAAARARVAAAEDAQAAVAAAEADLGGAVAVRDEAQAAADRSGAAVVAAEHLVARARGALGAAAGDVPAGDGPGDRSVAELEAALGECSRRVAEASAAREQATELDALVTTLTAHLDEARAGREDAVRAADLAEAARATCEAEARRLESLALAAAGGDGTAVEARIDARIRAATDAGALLGQARDAVLAERTGCLHLRTAERQLAEAIAASGLASVEEARAAALDEEERRERRDALVAAEAELKGDRARLAELLAEDLPAVAPDLEGLQTACEEADDRAQQLASRLTEARGELRGAAELLDKVAADVDAHAAQRDRRQLLVEVEGVLKGQRTARRVGLEDWVLRTYLDEVVVAANAHLAEMSNGRYELEVDPDKARGPGRAGLELAVLDAWTGQSRPTASLSGGETFLASLALALGLADVATGANAGLRLDALFVDEGFGSLDEDTLDLAIDVLDRLRRQGAMVGVITHVEAMKEALPVAIEVTPRGDRGGSTVTVNQVA